MNQKVPHRIVIYIKDIMNITGRRERAASKMMAAMKKKYKKKRTDFLTVKEFCAYTGFNEESVKEFLTF